MKGSRRHRKDQYQHINKLSVVVVNNRELRLPLQQTLKQYTMSIKSELEFERDFTIVEPAEGGWSWTREHLTPLKEKSVNNVWTVVEDNNGNLVACRGFHIVNVIYWLVTEESWDEDTSDYYWFYNDCNYF